MPNFIFSGLVNIHRPSDLAQTPYVFYTLLGAGFLSVNLLALAETYSFTILDVVFHDLYFHLERLLVGTVESSNVDLYLSFG